MVRSLHCCFFDDGDDLHSSWKELIQLVDAHVYALNNSKSKSAKAEKLDFAVHLVERIKVIVDEIAEKIQLVWKKTSEFVSLSGDNSSATFFKGLDFALNNLGLLKNCTFLIEPLFVPISIDAFKQDLIAKSLAFASKIAKDAKLFRIKLLRPVPFDTPRPADIIFAKVAAKAKAAKEKESKELKLKEKVVKEMNPSERVANDGAESSSSDPFEPASKIVSMSSKKEKIGKTHAMGIASKESAKKVAASQSCVTNTPKKKLSADPLPVKISDSVVSSTDPIEINDTVPEKRNNEFYLFPSQAVEVSEKNHAEAHSGDVELASVLKLDDSQVRYASKEGNDVAGENIKSGLRKSARVRKEGTSSSDPFEVAKPKKRCRKSNIVLDASLQKDELTKNMAEELVRSATIPVQANLMQPAVSAIHQEFSDPIREMIPMTDVAIETWEPRSFEKDSAIKENQEAIILDEDSPTATPE